MRAYVVVHVEWDYYVQWWFIRYEMNTKLLYLTHPLLSGWSRTMSVMHLAGWYDASMIDMDAKEHNVSSLNGSRDANSTNVESAEMVIEEEVRLNNSPLLLSFAWSALEDSLSSMRRWMVHSPMSRLAIGYHWLLAGDMMAFYLAGFYWLRWPLGGKSGSSNFRSAIRIRHPPLSAG